MTQDQVAAAIAALSGTMQDGFDRLHERIDGIHTGNVEHRKACMTRFQSIETQIAVDKALGAKEKDAKRWVDHAVKAGIGVGVGGILFFLWQMFTTHLATIQAAAK